MIVAVTGNTGGGKTSVAALFAKWGASPIDADRIGREVWEEDEAVRRAIVDALGPEVTGPGGTIDRTRLGAAVFGDRDKLDAFDAIVQPLLRERIAAELETIRPSEGIHVLDAALLFEWGLEGAVDRVVVVTAPADLRARRIAARHGIPRREAAERIESQESETEKARRADWVIENEGTMEQLEGAARALWEKILEESRAGREG